MGYAWKVDGGPFYLRINITNFRLPERKTATASISNQAEGQLISMDLPPLNH
jgi:hypothetical protein